MNAGLIISALRSYRFSFMNERELQDGIEQVLRINEIGFEREARLNAKDVIDFMCGDVGIEAKVASSAQAITRQLIRYAEHERVGSLILVSRKMQHAHVFPGELGGKPLSVVTLETSFL